MEYSKELADEICNLIATSNKGLKTILDSKDSFPAFSTFFSWLSDPNKKDLLDKYMRAREAQADFLADEILEIADDSKHDHIRVGDGPDSYTIEDKEFTNRSKIRIDARKWIASKLKPKKFGDKMDVTTAGDKLPESIFKIEIIPPTE